VKSPGQNSIDLSTFAGSWVIDPHRTTVEFRTKAMWVLPVKGRANVIAGGGTVGPDGSLTGTLIVDAASIDTKNKKRDDHLRTADFFEVSKYPTITFEATRGRLEGSGKIELEGTLTVHGQSKPLSLSAEVSMSGDSASVTTEVDIDRSSWGISLTPFGAGLKNRVAINAYFDRS
jgi:polyisoprenoid-binding protein YceI